MFSPAEVISADPAGFSRLIKWALSALLIVLAIRYLIDRCLTGWSGSSVGAKRIPNSVSLRSKPVLTEAEARFFRSLESAVDGEYLIWPQLPLWTFIDTQYNDVAFTNRIDRKRVDFCLVDRQTCTVYKAIELDDRTHQT